MGDRNVFKIATIVAVFVILFLAQRAFGGREKVGPPAAGDNDDQLVRHAQALLHEGRRVFRYDTFGDEAYWGDALQLHRAIEGVSPRTALAFGLKVDVDALPQPLANQWRAGRVDLDAPATTIALLELDAVVGIKGFFGSNGRLNSVGLQCAFCHSTVDDSLAPGIGHRLDGWANRDLNVGSIVALAPNLRPIAELLQVDVPQVESILAGWGPGRFDPRLDKDGKGTLIPPAFGLAGLGSMPYRNACVAAQTGSWKTRSTPDRVSSTLAALHAYQLFLPAPKPPPSSFDARAADRGKVLFENAARCASCHDSHAPAEIGAYPAAPLAGTWTHQKGGFYRDGRFATLDDVVAHYDALFNLGLTAQEKKDLAEYVLSL